MEWLVRECMEAAGCSLEVRAAFVGEDILVCLQGGERPHLGCVVQTEPRESLTGDGSVSATSSVLNYPGHKDEVVCRYVAEKISRELKRRVVCTGGFHKDGINVDEIREVQMAVEVVTEKLVGRLR
ncbi:hypothetical protein DW074_11890 [Ruminococcus sp. AF46-10NS]|jgi:hypothetical protein|nr:hypothetical protein [Ruminococcus sp. AF46-10NS]RHK22853.1 hypothetical protein DW074_11890 [Ruminococcus sp. AF46-10NS]